MDSPGRFVAFTLDSQRFALPLAAVEEAVRVVEITPLPHSPEVVLGVINVRGRVIPVFSARRRFCLPEREVELSDQLIIARASRRAVALVVDEVAEVVECPQESVVAAERILPRLDYVEGVVRLDDGMILIHDLDRFLSIEEEEVLDECMREQE